MKFSLIGIISEIIENFIQQNCSKMCDTQDTILKVEWIIF